MIMEKYHNRHPTFTFVPKKTTSFQRKQVTYRWHQQMTNYGLKLFFAQLNSRKMVCWIFLDNLLNLSVCILGQHATIIIRIITFSFKFSSWSLVHDYFYWRDTVGKRVRVRHDCFWFYFWLVDIGKRDFLINHKAGNAKPNQLWNYFRTQLKTALRSHP